MMNPVIRSAALAAVIVSASCTTANASGAASSGAQTFVSDRLDCQLTDGIAGAQLFNVDFTPLVRRYKNPHLQCGNH